MSLPLVRGDSVQAARVRKVDLRLEVVGISVADGERAKEFYKSWEWRLDADSAPSAAPPG